MYPDHTLLLEESEAFVVIDGNELPQEVEKIVAMRVSSKVVVYFTFMQCACLISFLFPVAFILCR